MRTVRGTIVEQVMELAPLIQKETGCTIHAVREAAATAEPEWSSSNYQNHSIFLEVDEVSFVLYHAEPEGENADDIFAVGPWVCGSAF